MPNQHTRRTPPDELFWPRVDKDGPIPDYAPHLGPCWIWTGWIAANGYGRVNRRKGERWGSIPAHRMAYELVVGPVPNGKNLDHLCRVTACVNPAHLEPVTERENILRGTGPSARNAAKTHCLHGHPLDGENMRLSTRSGKTMRRCLECKRIRDREYRRTGKIKDTRKWSDRKKSQDAREWVKANPV